MGLVKLIKKARDFLSPFKKEERENNEIFRKELLFLNRVLLKELKKTISKIENEK